MCLEAIKWACRRGLWKQLQCTLVCGALTVAKPCESNKWSLVYNLNRKIKNSSFRYKLQWSSGVWRWAEKTLWGGFEKHWSTLNRLPGNFEGSWELSAWPHWCKRILQDGAVHETRRYVEKTAEACVLLPLTCLYDSFSTVICRVYNKFYRNKGWVNIWSSEYKSNSTH